MLVTPWTWKRKKKNYSWNWILSHCSWGRKQKWPFPSLSLKGFDCISYKLLSETLCVTCCILGLSFFRGNGFLKCFVTHFCPQIPVHLFVDWLWPAPLIVTEKEIFFFDLFFSLPWRVQCPIHMGLGTTCFASNSIQNLNLNFEL